MKSNHAHITTVLDRSGSMHAVAKDTIGGFNHFLNDQKQSPGTATFTLVQFDHEYDFVHRGVNLQVVPELDATTYVPRGNTALLDAIGRAINETGATLAKMDESERPERVIFVILTDGEENASKEFTREQINQMIRHQTEAYSWQFVFLGANQDAIQAGGAIGIPAANAMTYAANTQGTKDAFGATGANVRYYRTSATRDASKLAYSAEDREKQRKAGAKD